MNRTIGILGLLLSGCVAHIPMDEQSPDVAYLDKDRLVISVIDERWRVREGKPATGIGFARSLGIPSTAHTYPWYVDREHKGQTLAQALEDRIVFGLNDEGWTTVAAEFVARPSAEEITESLSQNQAENILILILKDWWVDVNLNWVSAFKFDWDATVEIYNNNGDLISTYSDAGRDIVDEVSNDSHPNMIRRAYRSRLIKFLERPEIIDALEVPQGANLPEMIPADTN